MIKQIPNLITLGNLLCGCLAIVFLIQEKDWQIASLFLAIGLCCDFLDGFVARLLKAQSELGKQLDSLADLVSFGIFPSFLIFQLFPEDSSLKYLSFVIALASAWRLAKFNLDNSQTYEFKGLPTPANAMFLIGLLPFQMTFTESQSWMQNVWVLLVIIVGTSFLLISNILFLSLKLQKFTWKDNQWRYVLLIVSLILIITFQWASIVLIFLLYILLSLLKQVLLKQET